MSLKPRVTEASELQAQQHNGVPYLPLSRAPFPAVTVDQSISTYSGTATGKTSIIPVVLNCKLKWNLLLTRLTQYAWNAIFRPIDLTHKEYFHFPEIQTALTKPFTELCLTGNPITAVYAISANRPGCLDYFVMSPPSSYRSPSWMSYPPEPDDLPRQWNDTPVRHTNKRTSALFCFSPLATLCTVCDGSLL